jgi:hypothetical protein
MPDDWLPDLNEVPKRVSSREISRKIYAKNLAVTHTKLAKPETAERTCNLPFGELTQTWMTAAMADVLTMRFELWFSCCLICAQTRTDATPHFFFLKGLVLRFPT